jgi:hypothetical protein
MLWLILSKLSNFATSRFQAYLSCIELQAWTPFIFKLQIRQLLHIQALKLDLIFPDEAAIAFMETVACSHLLWLCLDALASSRFYGFVFVLIPMASPRFYGFVLILGYRLDSMASSRFLWLASIPMASPRFYGFVSIWWLRLNSMASFWCPSFASILWILIDAMTHIQ